MAQTSNITIKLRRGTESQILSYSSPALGEIYIASDTRRTWIWNGVSFSFIGQASVDNTSNITSYQGRQGSLFFASDDQTLYVHDGSAWIATANAGVLEAHITDTVIHNAYGFVDRTRSNIYFDNDSRNFTISGVDGPFGVYINSINYNKSTESIVLPATAGLQYVYYQTNGSLTTSGVQWDLNNATPIATVYYNTVSGWVSDERHTTKLSPGMHEYLHKTTGPAYISGLDGTFTTTTLEIASGEWADEDVIWLSPSTTSAPIFYKSDNSSIWKWSSSSTKPYYDLDSVMQYNNGNNLATVSNQYHTAYWVCATNNSNYPIILMIGQRQDNTLAQAKENNPTSIVTSQNLFTLELKILYRLIFINNNGSPSLVDVTDFRTVSTTGTSSSRIDHGSLSGLEDADHPASSIYTDTSSFNQLLSSSDTNMQLVLETIDQNAATYSYVNTVSGAITEDFSRLDCGYFN